VPANTNIKVVHRVLGSSSTSGTTEYLEGVCPESWALGSGSTIIWPDDTYTAEGSGGMASFIQDNEYAIGYLDAGHGHSLKFQEVALRNKDGLSLVSAQADIGAAADGTTFPAADADWSAVNLYDKPGATTWPITVFSYFYVREDLSGMHPHTAALLKAFLTFSWSGEGSSLLGDFGFTPLPASMVSFNQNTVNNVMTWPAGMQDFTFETSTDSGPGAEDMIISVKRRSYAEVQRELMATQIATLEAEVATLRSTASTVASHSHDHEHEEHDDSSTGVAIAALAVSIVALFSSSCALFYAMRAAKTTCFQTLLPKDSEGAAGSVVGNSAQAV